MDDPQKPKIKELPKAGLDPLEVTYMLPENDRVHAFMRVPPSFETPLRDVDSETGRPLRHWCGLHALWLMCHYLFPDKWNVASRPPSSARAQEILGLEVPERLAWTALRVGRAPSYLAQHHALLHVNGSPVRSYLEFFSCILRGWLFRPRLGAELAEEHVTGLIKSGVPVAIDVTLPGLFREHVMFVYGVTRHGFIVVDSLTVSGLDYHKVTPDDDPRLLMMLPFSEFRRRWGRGSGIWHVTRDGGHLQGLAPQQLLL